VNSEAQLIPAVNNGREDRSGDIVSEASSAVDFDRVDYSHPNGIAALIDVSLKISQGEVVAIMGANGAGKSTLVRHVNGLLRPTHGIVKTLGIDTTKSTAAALSRKVGIVFQNPNNQLFAQSVRAEIEFGLKNFGLEADAVRRRTDWALNAYDLKKYEQTPPMELSGGEKKRLCIALVLAWQPEIVILDEPTVGQDLEQKEKLVETIRMLSSQRRTVILVTHDIEFVWPMQPRIVLMANARIVADGSCKGVLGSESLTSRASVIPPQLVELTRSLRWGENYPSDVYEAARLIRNLLSRTEMSEATGGSTAIGS
jgi:energy-coupling factor transport system ATP-binding protein